MDVPPAATVWSSPHAAANNNTATRGVANDKGPILIHHRPNTWMLISCYGLAFFGSLRLV